jgi:hypothetical protein
MGASGVAPKEKDAHQIGGNGGDGFIDAQLPEVIAIPPLARMAEVQGVQAPSWRNRLGPWRMLSAFIPRRGTVVGR